MSPLFIGRLAPPLRNASVVDEYVVGILPWLARLVLLMAVNIEARWIMDEWVKGFLLAIKW